MHRTLIALLAIACSVVYATASSAEAAFTRWFEQNGGKLKGIEVTQFPSMGRGFRATRSISEDEEILHIPHKLIFSTKNFIQSVDERTRKVLETLGSDAALYAWLLLEKRNPDSFFKPYLDILPSYVSSLVYFNTTELQELQSAQLMDEAIEMQTSALADYEAFLKAYAQIMKERGTPVITETTISYEEYLWAMSMFNSRGLRFQGPVYMAPMADIFNYQHHPVSRPPNNGGFFAKHHKLNAQGITIHADRTHRMDASNEDNRQQVFEDYGDNSDEIYFKYHGFVPDENPFRCATLGTERVVADLLASTPSKAPNGALGDGLLRGASGSHRALFSQLEFNRLPSKCVESVSPTSMSATASKAQSTNGGYFGKGLEVFLIMISFTEEEASKCIEFVKASSKAGPRGAIKNWPSIFKECGFSATEEFLKNVRIKGVEAALKSPSVGHDGLRARVLQTIQSFLKLNLNYDRMSTGISEDQAILASLQSQLESSFSKPILHKYFSVKYRMHRKRILRDIASLYGATDTVANLTGKMFNDADVAALMKTGIPSVSAIAVELSSPTTDTSSAPLPADAPLSERIRVFNEWFSALSPIPCHITAMEIPEFRMGTITTRNIKKGEVYLGIPTSHGGIIDTDVAAHGKNEAVSGLIAQLISAYPKRDDFHELLFFLLHETFVLREKSFYWPYLSLLPTYEDMENNAFVPLLWAEEDIKLRLGPSDVAGLIEDYHAKTKSRYNAILKMRVITEFFPNSTTQSLDSNKMEADNTVYDVFTFRNYQWATVILDSRSIWWSGRRHLVPMLDFVNCQEHVQDRAQLHSTVLDEKGRYAITRAGSYFYVTSGVSDTSLIHLFVDLGRDFKEGEQLFENYGQPNHIYFTYHGFLLENNSHDCVHLELPLTADDLSHLNIQKAAPILQKLRLSVSKPSVLPVCLTHPIAPMVWAFLAVKTNTFEKLYEQELLGRENPYGITALLSIIEERLQRHNQFERSSHAAANRLLDAEIQHLELVRDKLLSDSSKYTTTLWEDEDDEL